MQFIVSSSALLKQLQALSGVLSTNSALPILECFLFDITDSELIISASDLETSMTSKLKADISVKGKVAVPAKMLLDTLKTLAEQPLSFTINPQTFLVEISSDYGKYKISGQNGEEFPRIPVIEDATSIGIPASVLLSAISKTIFATGNDELRPVMSGVFFQLSPENITFVATDAHKLVRYRRHDAKAEITKSFILPKKPLNLLKNILPGEVTQVTVNYNESNAFFVVNNIHLICRLIDGRYPNYEAVIPSENPNKLTVSRIDFLNSIRRTSIYSNKTTHQVRLKIAGSSLQISAEDVDFSNEANEQLVCQYQGDDMEIGFNSRFLIDMLSNIDTEEVNIELSMPNRAGLILPGKNGGNTSEDILMLIMPVMLNN